MSEPQAAPSALRIVSTAEANAEAQRLAEADAHLQPWRKWGPLCERAPVGHGARGLQRRRRRVGYFPHEHAASRAYRWGEDGIAGLCDNKQRLCIGARALERQDPILKERMFGLSNREGNHGEDVKELYYYLDGTPTYSYTRMLYKYPQAEFPYASAGRGERAARRQQPEFEISIPASSTTTAISTSRSNMPRRTTEDILIQVTVSNRGPEAAEIHVLPQIWFRNTWSWSEEAVESPPERVGRNDSRPSSASSASIYGSISIRADQISSARTKAISPKVYGARVRMDTMQGRLSRICGERRTEAVKS